MNKSKIIVLTLLTLSVTYVEAGIRASKNKPVAIKQDAVAEDIIPQQQPQTLEEQHMVIPFGKRQTMAQTAFCQGIRSKVATALNNLVETSNNNLTIGAPNTTKAPRLVVFQDPETKQINYVHYTPSKPIKMVNNEEQYIHETHKLFGNLAEQFDACGLTLITTQGSKAPANWLAWYETNLSLKAGAPRVYLILTDKKPTEAQVKEFETGMNQ